MVGAQVVDLLLEHGDPKLLAHELDHLEGIGHAGTVPAVPEHA